MENVRKKGSNLNAKKLAALVEMIVQVLFVETSGRRGNVRSVAKIVREQM